MREWLDRHGYSVEFNRRGFRFETPEGVSNIVVIGEGIRAIKHVTLVDVYQWTQRQIREGNTFFSSVARKEFSQVDSPKLVQGDL